MQLIIAAIDPKLRIPERSGHRFVVSVSGFSGPLNASDGHNVVDVIKSDQKIKFIELLEIAKQIGFNCNPVFETILQFICFVHFLFNHLITDCVISCQQINKTIEKFIKSCLESLKRYVSFLKIMYKNIKHWYPIRLLIVQTL